MQHTLISRTSWHYRLATAYGPGKTGELERGTDFCTYFWAVFRGGLGALVITAIGGMIAYGLGDVLGWLIAGLVNGFVDMGVAGGLLVTLVGAAVVFCTAVVAMMLISDWYASAKQRRRRLREARELQDAIENKPVGFVRNAYRTFHDKYCIAIKAEPRPSEYDDENTD